MVELQRVQRNDLILWPPYLPDLHPIKMAFCKLHAQNRQSATRTCQTLWRQAGAICKLFQPTGCRNYFSAAGPSDGGIQAIFNAGDDNDLLTDSVQAPTFPAVHSDLPSMGKAKTFQQRRPSLRQS